MSQESLLKERHPLLLRIFRDSILLSRQKDPDFLEVLRIGSSILHEEGGVEQKLVIVDLETKPATLLRGTEVNCYTVTA